MMNLQSHTKQLPQQSNDKRQWGSVIGDGGIFVLSELASQHDRPLLVITPDLQTASHLEEVLDQLTPDTVLYPFPDWETLPYDHFSPHHDIISQRLATLHKLPRLHQGVIIAAAATLMHYLMPKHILEAHSLVLKQGDRLDQDDFCRHLESLGYRQTEQVIAHGEYARRGSLLDIFPMGHNTPYRIDLFDEEVDSIRAFDPETQRSTGKMTSIEVLPAHECLPLEPYMTQFRQSWRETFSGNPNEQPIYQQVSQGQLAAGIEAYLPFFYEQTATIFDYLPDNTLIIHYQPIQQICDQFWQEVKQRYEQYRYDVYRPILPPESLFLSPSQLFKQLKAFPQLEWHEQPVPEKTRTFNLDFDTLPHLAAPAKHTKPLAPFIKYLETTSSNVLLCAETQGRREVLIEQLNRLGFQPEVYQNWQAFMQAPKSLGITVLPIETGFVFQSKNIAIVAEPQLFEDYVRPTSPKRTQATDPEKVVRSLSELKIGDPVVHIDHGIGRYQGLEKLTAGEQTAEYLTLAYANNDRVYVPVSHLHLVSRYSGGDVEHAPLHQLGSKQWEKTKRKAAQKIRDVAAELLDIYARRRAREGLQCQPPDTDYDAFANAFPFAETPDQNQAIHQVMRDLTQSQPMDRLICGDVGFGKTEVAMRAAFLAFKSGWQVSVLVPTTLLAEQHYQNFLDRYAGWPVTIEHVSRFRTQKEQNTVLDKLQQGNIDIIIGTHKLLQSEVQFKNLGLLIIDEEHRFGVRQKERIKSWRSQVNVLTLTATPIPRTLNMAFSYLRDLSIIATPPERRLSVKTFVQPYNQATIREAALREIMRGGQIYFIHNEVASIEKMAVEIEKLIPEARIAIAHGQMRERELEKIMTDFYHRRTNLLVCTTIIESGIDIPTANTMIINRAHRFGLAQLHQLRGRVGRSHHQAYAYLLVPSYNALTKDATKRLEAIETLEELGAGFTLATQDLEIRGAGELLGEEQSGQMASIGFNLYQEMLEKAVNDLKSGKEPEIDRPQPTTVEINLGQSALIPDDYIPDVHTRLSLYKRLANCQSQQALDALQTEMIDRFGLLPEPTKNLFNQANLRIKAQQLGIKKIEVGQDNGICQFQEQPNVDPQTIVQLIQSHPQRYQLKDTDHLKFKLNGQDTQQEVEHLLETLS